MTRVSRALSWSLASAALGVAFIPSTALAQTTTDKATAEALFEDGRQLLARGKLAEACPKLAESQRLDPATGTLLNLGDCYERSGKLASAWASFREAAGAAKLAGDAKREAEAQRRASALEGKLPKLTVSVQPGAEVAGLEITRDGVPMGKPIWGSATPVDPGQHVIEARAPGKVAWSKTVIADARAGAVLVAVPQLSDAAPAAPAVVVAPVAAPRAVTVQRTDDPGATQRTAGLVIGGAGLVGIGVGAVFGVRAIGQNSDSADHCRGQVCNQTGFDLREDALDSATLSTVFFTVGGAAVAGGLILLLTAPSGDETRVGLSTAPGAAKLTIGRSF